VRAIWRCLLVWLTVLAMPIQGIAAAGMLHCGPGLPGVPQHPAQTAGPGAMHGHHPGAEGAGAHAHHHGAAQQEAEAPDTPSAFNGQADHHCSACAACCLGAALPASMMQLPVPDVSCAPVLAPVVAPASFIAGGPERPPRHPLA
jgi:hypothetical protein